MIRLLTLSQETALVALAKGDGLIHGQTFSQHFRWVLLIKNSYVSPSARSIGLTHGAYLLKNTVYVSSFWVTLTKS